MRNANRSKMFVAMCVSIDHCHVPPLLCATRRFRVAFGSKTPMASSHSRNTWIVPGELNPHNCFDPAQDPGPDRRFFFQVIRWICGSIKRNHQSIIYGTH